MTGETPHTLLQRYGTAFAVSIACHAVFFAGILRRTTAVGAMSAVITVTLRAGDGEREGTAGAPRHGDGAAGPRSDAIVPAGATTVMAAPAVAEPPAVRPAPEAKTRTARAESERPRPAARERRRAAAEIHDRTRTADERDAGATPSREDGADTAVAKPIGDDRVADVDFSARAAGARAATAVGPIADGRGAGSGGAGEGATSGSGAEGGGGGSGGGDLRTRCASCPTPSYPARARRQGWQGTVDVALHVGADGAVETAQVGRSSGFALLDAAAVEVARRSRFHVAERTPGLHGVLRYRFVLQEPRAVKSF